MPFVESRSLKTSSLLRKISEGELCVCPPFQRGTDENGIWGRRRCNAFIESFMDGFPYGAITTVQRDRNDTEAVLDGAHRVRCIRDFAAGKLLYNKQAYDQLSPADAARFQSTQIPWVEVRLDRNDPAGTVTNMYINLQQGVNLSTGELLWAHAWQGGQPIIDLARFMVSGVQDDGFAAALRRDDGEDHNVERFEDIRRRWIEAFGNIRVGTRHKRLAFFTGVLLACARNSCHFITMKYRTLATGLDGVTWNQATIEAIMLSLTNFLGMITTLGGQDVSIRALGARVGCPSSLLLPLALEPIIRQDTTTHQRLTLSNFLRRVGTSLEAMHNFRTDIEDIVGRASHYTTTLKLLETIRLILPNYILPLAEELEEDSDSDHDVNSED